MKVSVVVPAYNEEKMIALCLDSLENQEEKAHEIIVVDNNSTDRTVPISSHFNVKIITERKQGHAYARNAGFNAATGDIIARCDADTHVPPDWIKKIKLAFKDQKIDAYGGPLCYGDSTFFRKQSVKVVKLHAKTYKTLQNHDVLYGPNTAITKNVWDKVKNKVNNDGNQVHEDLDLANHIAKVGKVFFDPNLIVYTSNRRMRKNPTSFFIEYPIRMIKTMNTESIDAKVLKKLSQFILSNPE